MPLVTQTGRVVPLLAHRLSGTIQEKPLLVEVTGERFSEQEKEEYESRVDYLSQKAFSCSVTGRRNMSYAQAKKSEVKSREALAALSDVHEKVMAQVIQWNLGSTAKVVDDIHDAWKKTPGIKKPPLTKPLTKVKVLSMARRLKGMKSPKDNPWLLHEQVRQKHDLLGESDAPVLVKEMITNFRDSQSKRRANLKQREAKRQRRAESDSESDEETLRDDLDIVEEFQKKQEQKEEAKEGETEKNGETEEWTPRDFPAFEEPALAEHLDGVLQIYTMLQYFAEPLQLSAFPLSHFVEALLHERPTHLLDEVHTRLLDTLRKDGAAASLGRSPVDSFRVDLLCRYLRALDPDERARIPNLTTILELLESEEEDSSLHAQLPVGDKIALLAVLVDDAAICDCVHADCDAIGRSLAELRKQQKQAQKTLTDSRKEQKAELKARREEYKELEKVVRKGDDEKLKNLRKQFEAQKQKLAQLGDAASRQETRKFQKLQERLVARQEELEASQERLAERMARLQEACAKTLPQLRAEHEEELVRQCAEMTPSLVPLGLDRFFRRYYFSESFGGKLLVQVAAGSPEPMSATSAFAAEKTKKSDPLDCAISLAPIDFDDESDDEAMMDEDEDDESESAAAEHSALTKAHLPLPASQWFELTDVDDFESLLSALIPYGRRESVLLTELKERQSAIARSLRQRRHSLFAGAVASTRQTRSSRRGRKKAPVDTREDSYRNTLVRRR